MRNSAPLSATFVSYSFTALLFKTPISFLVTRHHYIQASKPIQIQKNKEPPNTTPIQPLSHTRFNLPHPIYSTFPISSNHKHPPPLPLTPLSHTPGTKQNPSLFISTHHTVREIPERLPLLPLHLPHVEQGLQRGWEIRQLHMLQEEGGQPSLVGAPTQPHLRTKPNSRECTLVQSPECCCGYHIRILGGYFTILNFHHFYGRLIVTILRLFCDNNAVFRYH